MLQDFTSLNIIFIIAAGVLTFVILFIFAKGRSPASPFDPDVGLIWQSAQMLKMSQERDRASHRGGARIVHEPRLLSSEPSHYILEPQQPYHYRFRAIDDVKTLEEEIARQDPGLSRHPRESLRAFLLSSLAAPLDGRGQKLVHQFCDTYEFARHHPGEFGEDEYRAYGRLLLKLLDAARLLKSVGGVGSERGSPARRPRALDAAAARLRPAGKLPGALHKRYTALENMPAEPKLEDEVIRVPARSPGPPAPADETAV